MVLEDLGVAGAGDRRDGEDEEDHDDGQRHDDLDDPPAWRLAGQLVLDEVRGDARGRRGPRPSRPPGRPAAVSSSAAPTPANTSLRPPSRAAPSAVDEPLGAERHGEQLVGQAEEHGQRSGPCVPAEVVWLTWASIDARLASRCCAHVDGVGDLVARRCTPSTGRAAATSAGSSKPSVGTTCGRQRQQVPVIVASSTTGVPGQLGRRPTHLVDPHVVRVAVPTVRVVGRQDVGLLLAQDRRQARRRLVERRARRTYPGRPITPSEPESP